jgi:hypothetical protein
MSVPTAPPQPLDDVEPTTPAAVVLESAPSHAKSDARYELSLITEQQVLFSTAAAVPVPSTRWWTRATRVVAVTMRRIFVTPEADAQPKRRHYPPRATWLEDSRMAREMHRL